MKQRQKGSTGWKVTGDLVTANEKCKSNLRVRSRTKELKPQKKTNHRLLRGHETVMDLWQETRRRTKTPKENKSQIAKRPRDSDGPVAGNEASMWSEPGEKVSNVVPACWSRLRLFLTAMSLLSQPTQDGAARGNKARKVTNQVLSETTRLTSDTQLVVCCFHGRRRKSELKR